MSMPRPLPALSALAATALLTACTPSVSPNAPIDPFSAPIVPGQSAQAGAPATRGTLEVPRPRRGSGNVRIALLAGAQLPAHLATEFTTDTGFTIEAVAVDSPADLANAGADAVLGLDGADALHAAAAGYIAASAPQDASAPAGTEIEGAPSAIAYGRDDVCVIADQSWMSANSRALPTSFSELTSPQMRSLLVMPDPATTSVGRAFVQEAASQNGEGLGEFARALSPRVQSSSGAAIMAWSAASSLPQSYVSELAGAGAGNDTTYPLVVAPRSLIGGASINSGADSYGRAIASTCIARVVHIAATPAGAGRDGVESLTSWLLREDAQRGLALAGAVYPIDSALAQDTPAQWLLGVSAQDVATDDTVSAADVMDAWLATWSAALS